MNVCYVCMDSGVPVFGPKGSSSHVREFTEALAQTGRRVTIFAAKAGRPAKRLSSRIHTIPKPELNPAFPRGAALEIRALERNRLLAEALRATHNQRPIDLICERYSLWSFSALQFALAHRIPFVLEVNSRLLPEQRKYRQIHLEPVAAVIESIMFRTASLVVGVSRGVTDYVQRQSARTLPTMVLPNGVNLELFERSSSSREDRPYTVGFLGSLKPWHGIETLLEAFRSLRRASGPAKLLIVGDGPLREAVLRFADEHRLGGEIHVTGAVEKSRVPELLGCMDVAVAPYPKIEEFYFSPLKVFEYMASGRAIVASRIGQIPDILGDGLTGMLVEPGNPRDLAAKLHHLQLDAALRRKLGQNARDVAFALHGWRNRVESLLDVIPQSDDGQPLRVPEETAGVFSYAR